ncbi:MAG: recombinase family protein [Solidesulfovibrio sp. DCME]|uniref:recombinase family protein n=1 Tax=Solidesulfovibrio sp. DCME TaxID=3447380 RepID=UPI003D0BBF79
MPENIKVFGYCRISTDLQSNENQRPEIMRYAESKNLTVSDWIEVQASSRRSIADRRIYELLNTLKRNDHLIIVEISRLGRSIFEGVDIIKQLRDRGVTIHSIRDAIITSGQNSNAQGDLIISMQLYFAQTERDRIRERTLSSLQRKKEELALIGGKLGHPDLDSLHRQNKIKNREFVEKMRPIFNYFYSLGMRQERMVRTLNANNVRNIRGNAFNLKQVQRIIKYMSEEIEGVERNNSYQFMTPPPEIQYVYKGFRDEERLVSVRGGIGREEL